MLKTLTFSHKDEIGEIMASQGLRTTTVMQRKARNESLNILRICHN